MTAAATRLTLAAIGGDLVAQAGAPGERRGAALLRRIAGEDVPAVELTDLTSAPAWLRLPRAALRRLAQRAALASMAGALAASIDGAWLGGHAAVAGEDAVDWAMEEAPALGAAAMPAVSPEALEARGFALLAACLPDRLRPLLAWAPREAESPASDVAHTCVEAALREQGA